ncbi:unnamed protein product [Amaranthus hypochondriacus]
MAILIIQDLLQEYLQSLLEESVINHMFCEIAAQTQTERIIEQIQSYCKDMEALLIHATNHIEFNDVDYCKLAKYAQIMEERSLRIGAGYVALASAQLMRACQDRSKESLSRGLTWVKTEYFYTKEKLDAFAQMERKVIRLKNKHKT